MSGREPVTISGQTFVFDKDKGWLDKKTKKVADKELVPLLNSVSAPLPEGLSKVRAKLNKSIDPVRIADVLYRYDVNNGWIDEKSKKPAPPHLQKILSDAVGIKKEDQNKEAFQAITSNTGMTGQAASDAIKEKEPEAKTQVNKKVQEAQKPLEGAKTTTPSNQKTPDNKPSTTSAVYKVNETDNLIELIQRLSNISYLLKGKLEASKSANRRRSFNARGNVTEVKSGGFLSSVSDASSSSVSPLLIAGAIGAVALAFKPVRDTLSGWMDNVSSLISGIGSTFSSINSALEFIVNITDWVDHIDDMKDDIIEGNAWKFKDKRSEESLDRERKINEAREKRNTEDPNRPWYERWGLWETKKDFDDGTSGSKYINPDGSVKEKTPEPEDSAVTPVAPEKVDPASTTPVRKSSAVEPMVMPTEGTHGSAFGMRKNPKTGKTSMHKGLDIPAPQGTRISAASPGKVIRADKSKSYGNVVYIDHGNGVITRYAHMHRISVKKGQSVSAGDKIGEVGNTGAFRGNHLHFEVVVNGKQVDPKPYLQGKNKVLSSSHQEEDTHEHEPGETERVTKERVSQGLLKDTLFQILQGFKNVGHTDTVYKPWIPEGDKSKALSAASMSKKSAELDIKAIERQMNKTALINRSLPNLNKSGSGGVRVPTTTNDKLVVKQYLNYFDLA